MNTQHKLKTTDPIVDLQYKLDLMEMKSKLSTLWIFTFLNMIFRDLHEFGREGFLAEMMTGIVSGVQLTEELLLFGGIVVAIQIAMVILSQMLPYRFNRWANIIVGVLTIGVIFSNGTNDLDDIWFSAIEVITLAFIIWSAWTWSNSNGVLRSNVTSLESH